MESVSRLKNYFEEGCLSSAAVEAIEKKSIQKATEELQLDIARLDSDLLQLQDFLRSLQYLVKHNTSCVSDLLNKGLLDLMKVVFEQVLRRIVRDGPSETQLATTELCTETANVLADANSKAKASVVLELCPHFFDLLQVPMLGFQTRLEVLKSTNILLEQCPTGVKEMLLNKSDNSEKLSDLVDLVKTVGDYEFQVGIIECLMRVFPRKSRSLFASKFFSDKDMLKGFMAIKDKDFETDCRLFLNSMNAKSEDPSKGVFSLPCRQALLGNKQLKKPSDAGYEEFWVDFNIGSKRLTLFCEQDSLYSQETQMDEEMWETVAIYKSDVLQCAFHEQSEEIQLEIYLKSPVCNLYPSQHQDVNDNKIKIIFYPELEEHIAHAVGCTFDFGEKRSKVSTVNTPLQISMKKVQNADLMKNVKNCVQNISMPSQAQTSSQDSVSKRRKISVPSIPMAVPIVSPIAFNKTDQEESANDSIPETQKEEPVSVGKVDNQEMIANDVETNEDNKTTSKENMRDFAVPKTPVKKIRSKMKVKTPVVTVTPPSRKTRKQSAQCSAAEGESVKSQTKPKENEQHEVTIPDSLPFNDSLCKPEKASLSKASEKCLNDSGIGIDESGASVLYDELDTSKASKAAYGDSSDFGEKVETKSHPRNSVKGMARMSASKRQANELPLVEKKVQNKKNYKYQLTPLNEVSEEDTLVDGHKGKACENTTCAKDTNVGTDAIKIDECVVSIPDSLENSISSDKQSYIEEEKQSQSKINIEGKGKKKTKSKKCPKVVDKTANGKRKNVEKKEKFTDIDKSLKELHDLDNEEALSKGFKQEIQCDNERSLVDVRNGSDVYAFSEPKPVIHKPEVSDKRAVLDRKSKTKNSGHHNKDTNKNKIKTLKGREEPVTFEEIEKKNDLNTDKQHDKPRQRGVNEKVHCEVTNKKTDKLSKKNNCKETNDELMSESELDKKHTNKNQDKQKQGRNEIIEQGDSKRGKAKKKDKEQKKGNTEICDDSNENNSDSVNNGRIFRIRTVNQSHKEFEKSGSEKSTSPSCRYRSLKSSDIYNSQVTSLSIEKMQDKCIERKTPDNSPSKSVVNENKIKSSLKKNKNPSDSEKDANKRKSRVSFDLSNRQSQESDTQVVSQNIMLQNENVDSGEKFAHGVEDSDSERLNLLYELDGTSPEIKENRDAGSSHNINCSKSFTGKKLNEEDDRKKKSAAEERRDIDDKYASDKFIPCVPSPMSSDSSLYIESDDSYNARRYKMENGSKNTSKCKNRSSLKLRRNDFEDAKKEISVKAHRENSRPVLKDICNINNQSSVKGRKGPRKDVSKSKEQVISSAKPKRTDKKTDNCKINWKYYSGKSDFGNRNENIKEGKVFMHKNGSKMLNEDENSLSDREHFREECEEFDNGLKMEMEQIDEIEETQEDDIPDRMVNQNSRKGKQVRSSDKNKKGNSTFSLEQRLEKLECDDSFAVSQQSIQTFSNAKGKSMVFQMSYLKSKTNFWDGNDCKNEKPLKIQSYDPYDFEAHCENASMASEKINKQAKSKCSKQLKSYRKKRPNSKDHKVKVKKMENLPMDSQENFSQDFVHENVFKNKKNSSERTKCQYSDSRERKKDRISNTEKFCLNNKGKNCMAVYSSNLQGESPQMMVDLTDEKDQYQNNIPTKASLVQDEKTKKWYRTNNDNYEEYAGENRKENNRDNSIMEREAKEFPSVDSFNKSLTGLPSEDEAMIIDSSMEQNISQFSKILKEITSRKQIGDNDLNSISADLDYGIAEIKTPYIESLSCTPKVGAAKKKHYKPLNVSVIKTPQSCNLTDSEDDVDIQEAKSKQNKRKSRKKKAVKYKEVSESESEDEKIECRSRMSTDSVNLLDSSQNISNRSEKSWILERKKTPKLKKSSKTYKAGKKNKGNCYSNIDDGGANSDSQNDDDFILGDKLQMMKEYLKQIGTPLTISSLSIKTPVLTPSMKSLKSLEVLDENVCISSPSSPRKRSRKGKKTEDDIEVDHTQENYTSINMSYSNSDEESDSLKESQEVLSLKSYECLNQDVDSGDEERSMQNLIQQNIKLLADSGFNSGPSSEVRPTRSTLKRRFADIEENISLESSTSSQMESEDEMEKSVFIPKKLFKFDPAVNTQQAPSLYSDVTEETEVDFGFQSGLSTVMAAFGTDIQHHLQSKKQKIERFTKETLKETQKHFHHTLIEQQQYLSNITDDFSAKMLLELTGLEEDIERLSDAEKKMEEYFKSQFETLRCSEDSQIKRLNNMKKLHSGFLEKSVKVKKYNYNSHKNLQEQLKIDMAALQRKLVAETQRQQYMDVKMKLQQMF